MKVRVSSLLVSMVAVFLLAFSTFSAQAQEELPILETQDPPHRELNLDEDKVLLYDHSNHGDHSNHSSQGKDSVQVGAKVGTSHLAKNTKPDVHKSNVKEREGEDALSFNFLYYMFQKFKMSDLIDQ